MKLICIGEVSIRLQPGERAIKLGDIISEPSLVNLLKDHPCFEVLVEEADFEIEEDEEE
jgi:hypothetical protein